MYERFTDRAEAQVYATLALADSMSKLAQALLP